MLPTLKVIKLKLVSCYMNLNYQNALAIWKMKINLYYIPMYIKYELNNFGLMNDK